MTDKLTHTQTDTAFTGKDLNVPCKQIIRVFFTFYTCPVSQSHGGMDHQQSVLAPLEEGTILFHPCQEYRRQLSIDERPLEVLIPDIPNLQDPQPLSTSS